MNPMKRKHVGRRERVGRGSGLPAKGFTILEVLLAVLVLTIGAVAALGMQTLMTSTNRLSVQRAEATQLADTLVARIHTDALAWTEVSGPATELLTAAALDGAGALADDAWVRTGNTMGEATGTWNRYGMRFAEAVADDPLASFQNAGSRFCVAHRLRRAGGAVGAAVDPRDVTAAVLVDVRVYWARNARGEELFDACTDDNLDLMRDIAEGVPGAQFEDFRAGDVLMVERSTVIMRNTWWRGAMLEPDA